jgi:hypothetical protein
MRRDRNDGLSFLLFDRNLFFNRLWIGKRTFRRRFRGKLFGLPSRLLGDGPKMPSRRTYSRCV